MGSQWRARLRRRHRGPAEFEFHTGAADDGPDGPLRQEVYAGELAAALTMALSAFCFAVGARQADADFNFLGVLLNGLYLLFQALQVALQDSALRAPVWKSRVCWGHPIILHQVISRR